MNVFDVSSGIGFAVGGNITELRFLGRVVAGATRGKGPLESMEKSVYYESI